MANSNFRTLTLDKLDGVASTRNYIKNGSALQNVKGWTTYADAAGTSPVDGTGGSPTVTFTRTTSSPLSLDASFLFTKDAASRQGQGASYDFTIDRADQAKVCRIDFDYEVASGTYADGDLTVWLYDVTNAQLIQPSASSILNAVGPQKKQPLSFQTNSNSTSYRLIVHVASTSASAYTVKFDNVSVTRESVSQGTVATSPVAYTPTFTGFGTPTNVSIVSWRDGAFLYIQGKFTAGTSTATEGRISLGFNGVNGNVTSSDTTLLPTIKLAGDATRGDTPTAAAFYTLIEPSVGYITFGQMSAGAVGLTKINGNTLAPTSERISFTAQIPIQGWSSSQQLSSDADTRVVAAKYSLTSNETTAANADHIMTNFTTKVIDTHGAVSSSRFTAPVPGFYKFRIRMTTTSVAWTTTDVIRVYLSKNGSSQFELIENFKVQASFTDRLFLKGEAILELRAGDYIDLNVRNANAGVTPVIDSAAFNGWEIERVSGPAQIVASEVVAAKRYSSTTALVYNTTTAIAWTNSEYDTHGGFQTSTVYTVPAPGKYAITARYNGASQSASGAERFLVLAIRVNGVIKAYGSPDRAYSTTGREYVDIVQTTVPCAAGDTIDIVGFTNLVTSVNTSNNGGGGAENYITIERLGGVS